MSVVDQEPVRIRRYNGYLDPRYPLGTWFARGDVTGDATAGSAVVDLVFTNALAPILNSNMYSVEQLSLFDTENVATTYRMDAINFEGPTAGFPLIHRYALRLVGEDVGTGGVLLGESLAMLPMFLGAQSQQGTTSALSVRRLNTDTIVTTFEAEGYYWSPRSVLVDGGPQRPPTGLYRA